jgi:hypothetical protein
MIKEGQTAILTCDDQDGNEVKSKVRLKEIETHSFMPADFWFEYLDDSPKPIVHPDFGKSSIIKTELLLPEMLVEILINKNLLEVINE